MSQLLRAIGIKSRMVLVVIVTVLSIIALVSFSLNKTYAMQVQEKRIKTQHLVQTAVALVQHEYQMFKSGQHTEADAKAAAIKSLESLRYGDNDYFWINDMRAVVVMHPIKPELNGKDLSKLQDPNGKRLFQSFVDTVKATNQGNENYLWPKPGFDEPVEKISYVSGFKPWGWVIGTGVYIDDVEAAFWEAASSQLSIAALGLAITIAVLFLISNSIIGPMDSTNRAMQNISHGDGDLTLRLDASGNDEMSQLARSFNLFVDQIQSVIREVDSSTGRVASAAEQLTHATNQSSQVIHRQTSETDQVAIAVNEMAATIHEVAQNAVQAANTTHKAYIQTNNGKSNINETTETIASLSTEIGCATDVIKQLDAQANTIASVLDVIGEIAEQTNLLALNAAIEAARAGEQGRGFAVVADEVRTLASRTQASTHEIESMIEALQAGAKQAVTVMETSVYNTQMTMEKADLTQTTLETIAQGMTQVNDMINQIASAAEQQSSVAEQISASVVSIVDLSSDSTQAAEQTSQASVELNNLAGELKHLIHRFKV